MNAAALLRRTSAGFTPPQQASIKSWFKPEGLDAFANNDPIGSWPDAGPGNLPAAQATSANRPLAKTNVLNGLTVAQFDGVNDSLFTGFYAAAATQPVTRFSVARYMATAGNQYLLEGRILNEMSLTNAGTTLVGIYAGGAFVANVPTDTAWHIFCETFNGTSSNIRVGGGVGFVGNAGANSLTGLSLAGTAGYFANCQIAEVSATDALLTLAELNQWGNYLAGRSGLTWTTAT